MDALQIGIIGIVALFILLFSGMPIGLAFILVGFVGYTIAFNLEGALSLIRTVPYATFSDYGFSVIPLFILMGDLAFSARLSSDLYDSAHGFLGGLRGGLAMTTIAACAAFAAVSGSSPATAATMGKVALPEMKRYKYSSVLASGTVAAGGTIGILIPPSVIMIVYAIITEQSIGRLYMAGFIPGILQAVFFIVTIAILCWFNPLLGPPGPVTNLKEKFKALSKGWSAIVLIIIVIGGIYLGWFSANEAAGIGAFGALVIGLALRRITWQNFRSALRETFKTSGMIFIIITGALIFGYFLTVTGVSRSLVTLMSDLEVSRYVVIAIIIVIYLVLGCVMDGIAMVLITVPIFFPLVQSLGFDPIWFGIVVVIMVEAGLITPPVGMNVFVIKGIAEDIPMYSIFRGIVPYLLATAILLILLFVWPQIALFLPSTMRV
jgi:C4-dicarboxylate transporter DctM subunit